MAKVAAAAALSSNSLQIEGGLKVAMPMLKRKTPSELRGEQLKRTNFVEHIDESSACTSEGDNGLTKQEVSRNPRYIDMRMDELYPVKKSRFRMLSGKENSKENSLKEQLGSLKHLSLLSNIAATKRQQASCSKKNVASTEVSDDANVEARQTTERCSHSKFRSVTELSAGGEGSSSLAAVDMNKALKALAAREPLMGIPAESAEKPGNPASSGTLCSEFLVPGQKVPLDLTLKTYMQLVSPSLVNWIHRSITCSAYNGVSEFGSQLGNSKDQHISDSSGSIAASRVLSSMALHSWVYPQSTLPPSFISVLVSSAADGVEMDFLQKRQLAWQDSFRSLYYMLRKNVCNIFYVCTSQFVVMFTAGCRLGSVKSLCNAYITQSTRSLRAMLKEHDICFSLPLCRTKIEQVTTEDLVELSEIEKHNLGQTCRKSSFSGIDNTPQSLLAFKGNESVHGLYDFLLNYKSSLSLLTTADVPVLYSPVPFKNAAISSPEIKCVDMKRTECIGGSPIGCTRNNESINGSSLDRCCIIEVKDKYLPPWILSSICALIGADGRSFEASFVTELTSVGLNVALPETSEKIDAEEYNDAFGISGVMILPQLRSGQFKSFKYCNESYMVSLSPL